MSDNPIAASYLYLLEPEIRFLEAAVEHLIPTDELGPGARDAGVVVYIDRQLAGSWGTHGRMYRGGPWMEGTPQQGYQSRFTPQEVYRIAIREIDQHCKAAFDRISRSFPVTGNCTCSSNWRRTRSRCLRCHRNSSSTCCGATPRKGISPIRCTAATATRWAGSCSDFPACPGRIPPPGHQQRAVPRRTGQHPGHPDRPGAGRRGGLCEARDHQAREGELR